MKSVKGSIGRSVDEPDPRIRFYLFHGADEAESTALGERLVSALRAAKHPVAPSALRGDPGRLPGGEVAVLLSFGHASLRYRREHYRALSHRCLASCR